MIEIAQSEQFHAAVAAPGDKPMVACFSAPWCGGCKLVAPKVAALAEELSDQATFVKVSAEELEELCEEVEVDSFPHFRVYKQSKILGDITSSKFDKVEEFIRSHVAAETEEVPEAEASTSTSAETAEADEATKKPESTADGDSKKRSERDESETTDDDHVAKKIKTDEQAAEPEVTLDMASMEETEKAETEEVAEAIKKTDEGVEATTKADPEVAETDSATAAPSEKQDVSTEVEAATDAPAA
ncbi:hypothetical protein BBJ28_00021332 [Nothophytophthora sp. Chile5]|nr:hypothetical protein BBJ28_00021332 [Nothophytophthora sp. Chile5]